MSHDDCKNISVTHSTIETMNVCRSTPATAMYAKKRPRISTCATVADFLYLLAISLLFQGLAGGERGTEPWPA